MPRPTMPARRQGSNGDEAPQLGGGRRLASGRDGDLGDCNHSGLCGIALIRQLTEGGEQFRGQADLARDQSARNQFDGFHGHAGNGLLPPDQSLELNRAPTAPAAAPAPTREASAEIRSHSQPRQPEPGTARSGRRQISYLFRMVPGQQTRWGPNSATRSSARPCNATHRVPVRSRFGPNAALWPHPRSPHRPIVGNSTRHSWSGPGE